jgi:hypothetical protein
MIKVMCGINSFPTEKVIGMSVGQVREKFRETLNIPKDAKSLVNGKGVNSDYVLVDGVELEFVKETGEKGIRILAAA